MPEKPINNREIPIAILGTVGVPSRYGGFEKFVENLVQYHCRTGHPADLTACCSSKDDAEQPETTI